MTPPGNIDFHVESEAERIAVLETRANTMALELTRTRERLHDLESDRSTLRILVQQVADMARNVEQIAERAAERAVSKASDRSETLRARSRALQAAYCTVGVAFGGVVATLISQWH